MKNLLLVAVCILTTPAVRAAGPEAVEEKWEACNAKQDNGLANLGNSLNSSDHFEIEGSDPCSKCSVWNLGTVKRTGDIQYEKVLDDSVKHTMKLGFSALHILCTCAKSIPGVGTKSIEGQVDAIWTEPRFTIELVSNPTKNTAAFTGSKVNSIMADTCVEECKGGPDWMQQCEQMKKLRVFDQSLKLAIENLFPTQSTATATANKDLLLSLHCGDS